MWCKVSYFINDILISVFLQDNLTQVKLSVHQTSVVSEVKSRRKLNGHIVEFFQVCAGDINCKIKIEVFNVLEDAASVVHFNHGELTARQFVNETVKCSYNIRVSLKVDPVFDVFVILNLPDNELCPKIFVEDNESLVRHAVLDLSIIRMRTCFKSSNNVKRCLPQPCLRKHVASKS